jgi:riboflavin kinase, archaea type
MQQTGAAPFQTTGQVASGIGRGAEFLRIGWVQEELRAKLQLVPFPGTLNLRVSPEAREALYARRESFLRIADPSDPSDPACPGYLQRVTLRANGRVCHSAYLILPELTMYKDVLEVIAAENLRQTLGLKDGDAVEVEMTIEESSASAGEAQ